MSATRGHGKRTRRRTEAWGRRASAAGIVGHWLDKDAKRLTHRAERKAATKGCEFCGSVDHDWCTAMLPAIPGARRGES